MNQKKNSVVILMADDDEDDRLMAKEAFNEVKLINHFHMVENGEELMDYLRRKGKYADPAVSPRPGLDPPRPQHAKERRPPGTRGNQGGPSLRQIPIVVLTTSKAEEDILRSYDLGVNSFIAKPVTFEQLVVIMKTLTKYWFEIVELPPQG